ncbi:peptidase S9A prolyl oligopeptidase domain protein beta-propeller [Neoconidiobolus thromboides FSU 785]|nr:peptidase S9A prolyl oligopeptidase domain protein beta-propeller [Neoconidiobolus thromboides FSU 785]
MGQQPEIPILKKEEYYHEYHGKKYLDEYHWLRDDKRENEQVLDYLKSENEYSNNLMKELEPLSDEIYSEMVSRIVEDDVSVSIKKENYYYYNRDIKGQQYALNCRKLNENGEEEVLLDLNKFEFEYLSLGAFEVDSMNNKVAYTLDTTGDEKYSLFIKDLNTKETNLELTEVNDFIVWSSCNNYIFYTKMDDTLRPNRLFRHKVGDLQEKDKLLFEERDLKFHLNLDKSISKKYLFMETYSSTSSEVHFINLDKPEEDLNLFSKRQVDRIYELEYQEDEFLILTNRYQNEKFINFRLFKSKINQEKETNEENWEAILEYNKDIYLTSVSATKDYILLEERYKGLAHIRIINSNSQEYRIEFEEPIFVAELESQYLNYKENEIVFSYSSLTTPNSIYKFNVNNKKRTLLKQEPVLGNFNSQDYQSERIITSNGVPISLIYKKSLIKKDNSNPLHLYGYGSYGYSEEPYFNANIICLLDRGFIYAIAHIRGGTELGRHWYELEGKLKNKKNTFEDFEIAANTLIEMGYTSSPYISMEGGSAGGLLMGVVLNNNYTKFNAVIADVPFVDVINTMMDESIPLTVKEYEEWGNPNEKEYFDYILSYSPYNNLPKNPKNFPHLLIRSGFNDPMVQYWEPAKYSARLRDILKENNPKPISISKEEEAKRNETKILHFVNMGAGHFGSSGKYEHLKELAINYAFLVATAKRLEPFS